MSQGYRCPKGTPWEMDPRWFNQEKVSWKILVRSTEKSTASIIAEGTWYIVQSGCCNQESYVQLIVSSRQLSKRSLFTCTCYMHASATSIEVTALCNVHRFFPVLLKLGKIKIVKYSSMIFWPILCVCKVHSSFRHHCSSCNIDFPSIPTNNITSKMTPYNSSRYIHTMWSLQPGKKAVASENAWFIYQIDVGQYNH